MGCRPAPFVLVALLAACAPGPNEASTSNGEPATPPRTRQFGSLRDFVLVDLPPVVLGGARRWLFFDRFEVTRADWAAFVETPGGRAVDAESAAWSGDPDLPVGMVDLRQARAFARWRFSRLPTRGEWMAVATVGGRYNFPWGNKAKATVANTIELGLFRPTAVGVFESGRRGLGEPYDVIGNVSEWSETVSSSWTRLEVVAGALASAPIEERYDALALPGQFAASREEVLRTSGCAVWQIAPGVMPPDVLAAARQDHTPHEVLGADFQRAVQELDEVNLVESVAGGDRRLRTGIRIVAMPGELLGALARSTVVPSAEDRLQLRRFVERRGHGPVLRAAWADLRGELTPDELGTELAVLIDQLLED